VRRGELVLVAHAAGFVEVGAVELLPRDVAGEAAALGLDGDVLALSLALLRTPTPVTFLALESHAQDHTPQQLNALRRVSAELHRAMPQHLRASLPSAFSDRTPEEALGELLLCVKNNAHRALDSETASRVVGLGLFPPACLLNHSCFPSGLVSYAADGRELHIRALVDLPEGADFTFSYLAEEQLYAPSAERAALLRAAHLFEPVVPPERASTEACWSCGQDATLIQRQLRAELERAHHAQEPGDKGALRASVERQRELLHGRMEPALHRSHWLIQEACSSLYALGRALDDNDLVGRYALQLLTAREEALPLGLPHLAVLYGAYGAALWRRLRDAAQQAPASARQQLSTQAEAAFRASLRIRETCFGQEHTLTRATRATWLRVQQTREAAARKGEGRPPC
jgi:hypothetical protein